LIRPRLAGFEVTGDRGSAAEYSEPLTGLIQRDQPRYFRDAKIGSRAKIVFPNPQYRPSSLFQGAIYMLVASFVTREFLKPELSVVDGHIGVLGTSMPKAAVNEDRNLLAPKNKVWTAN
jgi:hypothetical protein